MCDTKQVISVEYTLWDAGHCTYMCDSIVTDGIKPSELERKLSHQWSLVRGRKCYVTDLCVVKVVEVRSV